MISYNIIDRVEATWRVCFKLLKENINNIVQYNYIIILIAFRRHLRDTTFFIRFEEYRITLFILPSEETSKKSVTMNGHINYNVEQQTFYIYDSQFFKRLLLDNKDDSYVTSKSTSTHRFYPYKLNWNKARETCTQEGGKENIIYDIR